MILKQFNTLSYACTDPRLLQEMECKLFELKQKFEASLRHKEGLVLLPNRTHQYKLARKSVRKAQKRLKENSTRFSSLNALRRKRKRGQKRYGQKANRLRLAKEQQNEKVVHCFLDFFTIPL